MNSGLDQVGATLVGIVTRDRSNVLPKSIASALVQKDASVRVSVIDDGSRDSTPQLAIRFPSVEWITNKESNGYMAARNYWMGKATEDYFVSLDDDAWFVQGDEISVAVDHLEMNPTVAAVAFDILSPDRPTPKTRTGAEPCAMFIGCGHLLRLSSAREVGFYELSPGSYGGEEKDLCLRLMDAGYRIDRLPGVHVWHDKTLVARSLSEQQESLVCNDLVMAVRRTPTLLLVPALVSKFCRHFLFGLRNRSLRPVLSGFVSFFRSLPSVWRSRRPVSVSALRTFMRLRPQ
jgi:glycosyltransferase involved in cell wall biosynthesis